MKVKAIMMLSLAGLLLAVSAPGSFAQTAKQAASALVQPTPRPANINKQASEVETAADTTLRYYNPFSNKLFDVTLRRDGNRVVRAVGIIFEAPFDGAVDRVDFELSNFIPSPGVAGTGKLRIKLIELPFIVTDPPSQPGDSVDVDFSELEARNFIGGSGAFINQIDVSNDDFEIMEGEQYFLQLALAEESNDAALTFVFDQGSDDSTNTNYFVPPDLGARTLVYIDSLGVQVNDCSDPTQPCDDFVALRDPVDTTFTHLNVLLELQLSKPPPPPPPPPNTIALMQFIHNVPGVGMVDVYVGDSLVVEDIDYREASLSGIRSFVIAPAGEQTLDLVAATDPDNSNPIFTKTITLAENRQYWAVALGTTPGQLSDVVVEERTTVKGEPGTVTFVAVHGAGGADSVDVNILDETPLHAVVNSIADDLAFGQVAMPVSLDADSTFNVEVAVDTMQVDVFRLTVAAGGGDIFDAETILLLTSGIVGGDPALTLLTVDGRGVIGMPLVATATEDLAVPEQFALHGNFPNPFNPTTTIRFDLGAPAFTTLTVYNLLGQEVATLVAAPLAAGAYEMVFDAAALPSGAYLYRLTAGQFSQQRMLMLVK